MISRWNRGQQFVNFPENRKKSRTFWSVEGASLDMRTGAVKKHVPFYFEEASTLYFAEISEKPHELEKNIVAMETRIAEVPLSFL